MYINNVVNPVKIFNKSYSKEITKPSVSNGSKKVLFATLLALASLSSLPANSNSINRTNSNKTEVPINQGGIIEEKAKSMNLSPTNSSKVYFDSNKSCYYIWNSQKQIFEKSKNIESVMKTGYIKTKKGEYLTPDAKPYIVKDLGKYLIPCGGGFRDLPRAMAVVNGYETTSLAQKLIQYNITNNNHLEVYYDKENDRYLNYDCDAHEFKNTSITDVCGDYFTENNKLYKIEYSSNTSTVKNVSNEEYQANKQGFSYTKKQGVYAKKNTPYYFTWNINNNSFTPFGDVYDKEKMLTQKPNGRIDDFRQGNIGDCWLLSAINGMNNHKDPFLRQMFRAKLQKSLSVDNDGNVTVKLYGPKKEYKISKEEMDSVLVSPNYHYSIGDRDVLAIELAVEKYKNSLDTKIRRSRYTNIYNMSIPPEIPDKDYALDGGKSFDAIHLLTGMKSHFVRNIGYKDVLAVDNFFVKGNITEDYLLQKLENNIVMVGYKEDNSQGAHGVVLHSIDEDNVYVIDSNIDDMDPDKTVRPKAISKDKFFKELIDVTYTDLTEPIKPEDTKAIRFSYVVTPGAKPLLPEGYNPK